jgi:hypothetical protein
MTVKTLTALAAAATLSLAGCAELDTGPAEDVDEVTITEGAETDEDGEEQPKEKTIKTDIAGDGTWLVGDDVKPGVYVAVDPGECYWERVSGLSGDFEDLIANDNVTGQAVVQVKKSDEALSTNRCGGWVKINKIPRDPQNGIKGDGTWIVGKQIKPGTYRTTDAADCYWERTSGFSGEFDDLIANDNVNGQAVVEIKKGDVGFTTNRCGAWKKVG